MEYNLIKISELKSYKDVGELKDLDLVLVEVQDSNGKWITAKAQVQELFSTSTIKLTNASMFSAQLGQFAQDLGLGTNMTHQEHYNIFVGKLLSLMFEKLNQKPDIILHEGPSSPNPLNTINRSKFNEGTLWIDTRHYRVYVYRDLEDSTGGSEKIPTWVGLTDR